MNAPRTRRPLTIALLLITATGIGTAVMQSTRTGLAVRAQAPPTAVEVAALIDGDTFDVRVGEVITRVRLADVRTPPPPRPDQPAGCLAADASARLASLIPVGTRLTLTYGKNRAGLPTAEAITADGRLVNAEIVRAGYAHLVSTGVDPPMPADTGQALNDAAQDAAANQRGMHSAAIPCTVPGQVKALADAVAAIATSPGPAPTALDLSDAAGRATVARMAAEELRSAFAQDRQDATWLSLNPAERRDLLAQVQDACAAASTAETLLRDATSVTVNRDVTRASAQKDAARLAKVLADLRKAEADRAALAARRAAAARKARADALAETRARAEAEKARRERARREQERTDDSGSRDSGSGSSDSRGD